MTTAAPVGPHGTQSTSEAADEDSMDEDFDPDQASEESAEPASEEEVRILLNPSATKNC